MLFLGLASNYSARDTLRHLFAIGSRQDSEDLRQFLAKHYSDKDHKIPAQRVALHHNGRSALTVAIKNAVPRGSGVAITGFTCKAVVQAVRAAHCQPVFVDINRETLDFDTDTLAAALKKHRNTKAIIIQNTLGTPADITKLEKAARKLGLKIIEDLAHCTGRHYPDGRECGTVGDTIALSFGKGKAIDTISGGAVVIRDASLKLPYQPGRKPSLPDRLRDRWYPVFGALTRGLYHLKIGKYFMAFLVKIHFVQRSADAVLNTQLRLPCWQAKLALRELRKIPSHGYKNPLRRHLFVQDREELLERLAKEGFFFQEVWYEVPISPARYYKKQYFPEKECPVAVEVAKTIINLPSNCPEIKLRPAQSLIRPYRIKDAERGQK